MEKKRIFITGAGGFIGFNLAVALAKEGHQVSGIDIHSLPANFDAKNSGFEFKCGDFRDSKWLEPWLKNIDVIVHLASAHLQISLDTKEYWSVNVHSLQPFLELARKSGVKRFVHISSVGVYGKLFKLPADEQTACNPQSVYGETKLAGETKVLEFFKQTGFPVVILRPAWVYGPYCPRTLKIYRTLRKGRFVMIGGGQNLRHPLHIDDMIDAVKLAFNKDDAKGNIYLIAGDTAVTTRELIQNFCTALELKEPKITLPYWLGRAIATGSESIFGLLKKEPPISRRSLEFFDTNNEFDIQKAKKELGFKPQHSFSAGLRQTKDWLKSAFGH